MAAKKDFTYGVGLSPTTGSVFEEVIELRRLKKQVKCQAEKLAILRKGLKRFTLMGSWKHDYLPGKRIPTHEWNYVEDPWEFAERMLKEERDIK